MKKIIDFLDLLEKAGLDVEAFFALSGSEKARIAAAMVAVMKVPSDSGQTVVIRPPSAQQNGSRKVYIVNDHDDLLKVECTTHREWPKIGLGSHGWPQIAVVGIGTEMYLGQIGDVGPAWRLASAAEMMWYVAAVVPKTTFIGGKVNVHGRSYQLRLKLRNDGSWSQDFGTEGDGSFPALLVKINEDYAI